MTKRKPIGVYIGHGNSLDGSKDCGCTYKKYTEASLMKAITGACVEYLRGSGVEVITDWPSNKINMVQQVAKSNAKACRIHVAFHCDYDKAPSGTLPLYTSTNGKRLAKLMNKHVMNEVKIKTRGIGKRNDLYELNATDMPACIFECGSIKADLKVMRKKADAFGKGAANGICEYLGIKFTGKKA